VASEFQSVLVPPWESGWALVLTSWEGEWRWAWAPLDSVSAEELVWVSAQALPPWLSESVQASAQASEPLSVAVPETVLVVAPATGSEEETAPASAMRGANLPPSAPGSETA
jgi:hypothetical protein